MTASIQQRVHEIFATTFRLKPAEVSDAQTPADVRGWDSLGHLRLIGALEDGFALSLADAEVMEMDSVAKIVEILTARGLAP